LFALAACGSSKSTGPTVGCVLEISNAYYYYGTPDSRTDSGTETDLFWGRIERAYIRQADGSCSIIAAIGS
ncbi:MAG TPA: hypothetical protein VK617_00515, partial [Gemmatimonadaceae bacterium]|nr:hypothetical protein [Gemmatimonadaceae bacterium]